LFDCEAIPLPKLIKAARDDADWWSWKDTLQAKHLAYNGRVISHKATVISMDLLPCFLAVYFDEGGCEEYEEEEFYGRFSPEAVRIARWLDRHGSMAVDRLRRHLFPHTPRGTRAFHKALQELQTRFKIAVTGLEDRSWGVRVVELFAKWVPSEVMSRTRRLTPEEARNQIVRQLVRTAGALTRQELIQMLRWERDEVESCVTHLLVTQLVTEKRLWGTTETVLAIL